MKSAYCVLYNKKRITQTKGIIWTQCMLNYTEPGAVESIILHIKL